MMKKILNVSNMSDMDKIACGIGGGHMVTVWYVNDIAYTNTKLVGGKKNPLYGRLSAWNVKNLQDGCDYTNIKRKKLNDPTFVAKPLPWGHWFEYPRIIEHKDMHYLRCYPTAQSEVRKRTIWVLDGKPVTNADLIKYIQSNIKPSTADVNDFRYDHIVRIKADGVTYNVSL